MAKILVIEDEDFLRDLIVMKLKSKNYETLEAISGKVGLKKALEEKPDLILSDLILAGMDGFEFLEKIKADAELAKIPVIIMSNLGQKEEIDKAMKLGAVDFVVKAHINPSEIVERVGQILAKK